MLHEVVGQSDPEGEFGILGAQQSNDGARIRDISNELCSGHPFARSGTRDCFPLRRSEADALNSHSGHFRRSWQRPKAASTLRFFLGFKQTSTRCIRNWLTVWRIQHRSVVQIVRRIQHTGIEQTSSSPTKTSLFAGIEKLWVGFAPSRSGADCAYSDGQAIPAGWGIAAGVAA